MRKTLLYLLFFAGFSAADEKKPAKDWELLFDGETLTGWTNSEGKPVEEGKWVAEGGVLSRKSLGRVLYFRRRNIVILSFLLNGRFRVREIRG